MPLRDRLHDWMPDEDVRHSLQTAWACALTGQLNRELSRDEFRAGPDVQSEIKALEGSHDAPAPPSAITVPALVVDRQQVLVAADHDWLRPAGIVAFVPPRVKAARAKWGAFVARCVASLSNATGLVVIDAVPGVGASPCADLADALALSLAVPPLCALAFRTVRRGPRVDLDVWVHELVVGAAVPAVPLGLRGGPVVLLDLEATYTAAIEATGL
jgi:hypothetical protein